MIREENSRSDTVSSGISRKGACPPLEQQYVLRYLGGSRRHWQLGEKVVFPKQPLVISRRYMVQHDSGVTFSAGC